VVRQAAGRRGVGDGVGELVCVECGARSVDGVGWKAEVAPDLLEGVDADEVAVYCATCYAAEFDDA
jgi:hypothetical protein